MSNLIKLQKLKDAERVASEALTRELERQFPKGTRVAFTIMCGQKNMSTGVVIGYTNHGYLAVEHDQAKKYSRNAIRDVSFEKAQII